MKEIEIKASLVVYDNIDELPEDIQQLMRKAIETRKNAYAPYSKFKVGAAILLEDGTIVLGNNQENAAYPSGLCAERTAIYYAGANHPGKRIEKMALTAASEIHQVMTPTPPCGSCRQAISEYEIKQDAPIEIYFMGETGKVVKSPSLGQLLPLAFDKTFL